MDGLSLSNLTDKNILGEVVPVLKYSLSVACAHHIALEYQN